MHIKKSAISKGVWTNYVSAAAWYKSPHTFAAVDTGQLFNGKKNCPVKKGTEETKKVADVRKL